MKDNQTACPKFLRSNKAAKMPKRLMRNVGGSISEVKVGSIVVDVRGKTYYVESYNDMTNKVDAVSTCERHYFVSFPANIFGLYWEN